MRSEDFEIYDIHNFTIKEIVDTNADFFGVELRTIKTLDIVRDILKVPIYLNFNGINSGYHESIEHKEGKAVDFTIKNKKNYYKVFKTLLRAGFKGIGIYYTEDTMLYNFHADTGEYRFWSGVKLKNKTSWEYGKLIIDPKKLG